MRARWFFLFSLFSLGPPLGAAFAASAGGCASLSGLSAEADSGAQEAATVTDSAAPETSVLDASVVDGATRDANRIDSALEETGPKDAGEPSDADTGLGDGSAHADSSPADSGATVADSGSADSGDWCLVNAPDANFCDDFDRNPFGYGWIVNGVNGGNGGLDPSIARSPPYSFLATTPALDAGAAAAAFDLQRSPAGAYHWDVLGFDVYFDPATITVQMQFASIQLLANGSSGSFTYYALLAFTEQGITLTERLPAGDGGGQYVSTGVISAPPPGQWIRLQLAVSLVDKDTGAGGTVEVIEDGTPILSNHAITNPYAYGVPVFAIGQLYSTGPTGPLAVHFDNVTLTTQ